ncbi:MAG TPA: bacterial transcriptional activator domain-containing protein, partial [Anaerolinea sp.]|nr:bacterial transcriptional activator domain-containing protein [Anaerolinea sp.]
YPHQGAIARAVASHQRWGKAAPANEETQVMLVMAYENSGHRCLALKQYRIMVEILQQEYGAAPSPESQRLYAHLVDPDTQLSILAINK